MAFKLWNSASNDWSWAGSFTPSGVPVSSDNVMVPKTATVAPMQGLSQGTVDLASLRIEPGCMFGIGDSDNTLTIGADLFVHQGWAPVWLSLRDDKFIDHFVLDSPNWENACTIKDAVAVGAGTHIDRLTLLRGKFIQLEDPGAGFVVPKIDFIEVGYRNSPQGDVIAEFSAGLHADAFRMNAGVAKINNTDSLVFHQSGGRATFVEDNAVKVSTLIQSGGSLDMRGYPDSGTDLVTTLVMMGGVQTWLNDPRPKTINSAVIMPGASLLLPSSVTITSGGSMVTPPIAA